MLHDLFKTPTVIQSKVTAITNVARASALKRLLMLGLVLVAQIGLSACSSVSAWERDKLARPEMGWVPDSMDAQLDDHIYFSKEGSNGGGKAAGGGCGCN